MPSHHLHRLHVESHGPPPPVHRSSKRLPSFLAPSLVFLLTLAHCLGLACSVFVLAWVLRFRGGLPSVTQDASIANADDLLFNVHPVLMVVGFIVLTSEAILVFRGVHGTKAYKKGIHLTVQAIAFLMAILGIWAAFRYHSARAIDHFYSLHSWFGITTVALFGFQWISAYGLFWYPGASGQIRAALLPWHVFMGFLIYSMALISAETGFLEKLTFLMVNKVIGRFSLEAMFVNCIALLLIVYGAFVMLASVTPKTMKAEAVGNHD